MKIKGVSIIDTEFTLVAGLGVDEKGSDLLLYIEAYKPPSERDDFKAREAYAEAVTAEAPDATHIAPAPKPRGRPRKTTPPDAHQDLGRKEAPLGVPLPAEPAKDATPIAPSEQSEVKRGRLSSKGAEAPTGPDKNETSPISDADLTKAASQAAGDIGPSAVREIISRFTPTPRSMTNTILPVNRHNFLNQLKLEVKTHRDLTGAK